MSQSGLEAVRRAVDEVKSVIGSLTDEEWAMQSGCDAWTVKENLPTLRIGQMIAGPSRSPGFKASRAPVAQTYDHSARGGGRRGLRPDLRRSR